MCDQHPSEWFRAQAGQDRFVLNHFFCNRTGVFVEFGARDGLVHSNTYLFANLGWKGLLFEADAAEAKDLQVHRPDAVAYYGAVCPPHMRTADMLLSRLPGWSGFSTDYVRERVAHTRETRAVPCFSLSRELERNNLTAIDYLAIDTEGSELSIVKTFPWSRFRVDVVQIEILDERQYHSRIRNNEKRIVRHMTHQGFSLHTRFVVSAGDTYDLMFVRNVTREGS
jgi:hypothetical protein